MGEQEDLKQRIATTIKEYDNQCIHRTGTEVDKQSAHWLAGEIKKIEEASVDIETLKIIGVTTTPDPNFILQFVDSLIR